MATDGVDLFVYFKGPEGITYEYSWGVRLITDEDTWRPRYFDPTEPGSIDMWQGPTRRVQSQPQIHRPLRPADPAGTTTTEA